MWNDWRIDTRARYAGGLVEVPPTFVLVALHAMSLRLFLKHLELPQHRPLNHRGTASVGTHKIIPELRHTRHRVVLVEVTPPPQLIPHPLGGQPRRSLSAMPRLYPHINNDRFR